MIVPVPDSGNCAALGYSLQSGIPFEMAFVRNHYVGRSFLQPSQFIRDFNVRVKLNLIADLVRGKSVVIVDDSIVRGTTSQEIVQMARDSGARRVIFASAAPPVRYPNVYGIDMPTRGELIAFGRSDDEICRAIGADALIYQDIESMKSDVLGLNPDLADLEASCFDGRYVTGDVTDKLLDILESSRLQGGSEATRRQLALNLNHDD